MKIDRKAFRPEHGVARVEFNKSCLDCTSCAKLCWAFVELTSLPGAVLHDRLPEKA